MYNEKNRVINFIAVDWGTSNLRLWAIDHNDEVVCKRTSDQGMSVLSADEFETVLVGLIEDLLSNNEIMPIIVCGMAGSKSGWMEAPYESVPVSLSEHKGIVSPKTKDHRISVKILPGLKQNQPEDVMRGEETQIAGFLKCYPDYSGCLCLPGTHTKWVLIEKGSVTSFQTSMAGELFNILNHHSILRLTLDSSKWDEQEFINSAQRIMVEPALLLPMLFRIRARTLVLEKISTPTEAVLSGLLIGSDVSSSKAYWENKSVFILGEDKLAKLYAHTLLTQNIDVRIFNVEKASLNGLISAYKILSV